MHSRLCSVQFARPLWVLGCIWLLGKVCDAVFVRFFSLLEAVKLSQWWSLICLFTVKPPPPKNSSLLLVAITLTDQNRAHNLNVAACISSICDSTLPQPSLRSDCEASVACMEKSWTETLLCESSSCMKRVLCRHSLNTEEWGVLERWRGWFFSLLQGWKMLVEALLRMNVLSEHSYSLIMLVVIVSCTQYICCKFYAGVGQWLIVAPRLSVSLTYRLPNRQNLSIMRLCSHDSISMCGGSRHLFDWAMLLVERGESECAPTSPSHQSIWYRQVPQHNTAVIPLSD